MKDALPEGRPAFDVWIHLTGGMDQAREEFDELEPEQRLLLELMAEYVFHARAELSLPSDNRQVVSDVVPVLDNPWVKYALDMRLAEDMIDRGVGAFDRYRKLVAVLVRTPRRPALSPYVREASLAYVYGFYPSCVVFCGASLERLLVSWLTDRGLGVPAKATAGKLLARVGEESEDSELVSRAQRLISLRNDVAHGRLDDHDPLDNLALEAIGLLTELLPAMLSGTDIPDADQHVLEGMIEPDRDLVRLCGALDGFRQRHGRWPTRVIASMSSLIRLKAFLGESSMTAVTRKVELVPGAAGFRAEDEVGRQYDYGREGFPRNRSKPPAMDWLGIRLEEVWRRWSEHRSADS